MGPCAGPGVCCVCWRVYPGCSRACACAAYRISGHAHVVECTLCAQSDARSGGIEHDSGKEAYKMGSVWLSGFGTGCSDSPPRCVLSSVGSSPCRARASHCSAVSRLSTAAQLRLQSACEGRSAAVAASFGRPCAHATAEAHVLCPPPRPPGTHTRAHTYAHTHARTHAPTPKCCQLLACGSARKSGAYASRRALRFEPKNAKERSSRVRWLQRLAGEGGFRLCAGGSRPWAEDVPRLRYLARPLLEVRCPVPAVWRVQYY